MIFLVIILHVFLVQKLRSALLTPFSADVALFHGCPRSYLPNPVEGLLEIYEDMVEVLLVLEIFLTENV